jgi:hypothetical protein
MSQRKGVGHQCMLILYPCLTSHRTFFNSIKLRSPPPPTFEVIKYFSLFKRFHFFVFNFLFSKTLHFENCKIITDKQSIFIIPCVPSRNFFLKFRMFYLSARQSLFKCEHCKHISWLFIFAFSYKSLS